MIYHVDESDPQDLLCDNKCLMSPLIATQLDYKIINP